MSNLSGLATEWYRVDDVENVNRELKMMYPAENDFVSALKVLEESRVWEIRWHQLGHRSGGPETGVVIKRLAD